MAPVDREALKHAGCDMDIPIHATPCQGKEGAIRAGIRLIQ